MNILQKYNESTASCKVVENSLPGLLEVFNWVSVKSVIITKTPTTRNDQN